MKYNPNEELTDEQLKELSEDEFNKRDSLQNKNTTFPENKKFKIVNHDHNNILVEILEIDKCLST